MFQTGVACSQVAEVHCAWGIGPAVEPAMMWAEERVQGTESRERAAPLVGGTLTGSGWCGLHPSGGSPLGLQTGSNSRASDERGWCGLGEHCQRKEWKG